MIEDLISMAAFGAFRRSGTYTPPTDGAASVEVEVILDLAIEAFDSYGQLIGHIDTADFRLDQVQPEKGGTLSGVEGYDGIEWEIVTRGEDDGILVTMHLDRK